MTALLQTVIPVVLTALIAGQVAVTRTGRLRADIRVGIDLLGKLPAGHPSRATLKANIGELVDTLVRRQRRRFKPITRAGAWFGVNVTLALLMVAVAAFTVWRLTGRYEPEPLTRQDHQSNLVYYTAFAVVFAGFAVKAWWQQRREHPKATPAGAQPPTGSETPSLPPRVPHERDRGPPRRVPDLHPAPPGQPRPAHGERARPRLLDGAGPAPAWVDSRVAFLPEGPGLAALESPELAEIVAELLTRYDPAYTPPPDLPDPFDPARDHLVVIFEGAAAYLYRLDGTPHATKPC